MYPDLDKTAYYIRNKSRKEKNLDVINDNLLLYSAMYQEHSEITNYLNNKYPCKFTAQFPIGNNGVVDIQELLSYEDKKFIQMVYLKMLGRIPDEAGLRSYLNELRIGALTKRDIIFRMAGSAEGVQKGVRLTGFEEANIEDFLKYRDREFIENAYIIIMRRLPDEDGMNYYLSLLRSSVYFPEEILRLLRYSEEGCRWGITIHGLEEACQERIRQRSRFDTPIIGRIRKTFEDRKEINDRIDEISQRAYMLEDSLYNFGNRTASDINRVNGRINERCAEASVLNSSIAESKRDIEELSNRIQNYVSDIELCKGLKSEFLSEINKLKGDFELLSARVSELIVSTRELRDNVSDNENKLDSLNGCLDQLSHQVSEHKEGIAAIKENDTRTLNSIGDINNRLTDNTNNIDEVKKWVSAQTKDIDYVKNISVEAADRINSVNGRINDISSENADIEKGYHLLDEYVHQIGDNVRDINSSLAEYDQLFAKLKDDNAEKTVEMLLTEICNLSARVSQLEKGGCLPSDTHEKISESDVHSSDSDAYDAIDYMDFENKFRGSREHVKKVQTIYLPYFIGRKNVLDLGCGRGEFTEMLHEQGVGVTGVDQYAPYIEYMKMLGLKCVLADAAEYLASQESVDGVFMCQVVEHIPVSQIIRICRMAYEKLEKGSYLIMETPNPESLAIFTNSFYMDPSHKNPIHPQTLKYIAQKAGFSSVEIQYTESSRLPFEIPQINVDDRNFDEFNNEMARISKLLYGSQDYAVIAKK